MAKKPKKTLLYDSPEDRRQRTTTYSYTRQQDQKRAYESASASPAEKSQADAERRKREKRPRQRTLKTVGAPNKVERAGDQARLADIQRRQAEEEARRRERLGKRPSVGMGPAQGTTGGGLGMLTQRDRSKPKKMNMGGAVMKARGGTIKGVF